MATLIGWIVRAVVFGTIVMYGAMGEILTEKAGHLNLGTPGIMCIGGAFGFAGAYAYENAVADPNAFLWLWNDALGLNKIPAVIHRNIGIGLAVYGIGLSFWEKYTGKALFYAVGRDWGHGCYVANSGLVLFISALCFVPSFPVKGYAGILCCVLIACLLNMVLRGFMNLLQSRRETRLLWEIGTADTRINWKGKGYLCGRHMKVRVQGSEKGTEIPAGAPVMVVGMEGFKPVVAQV